MLDKNRAADIFGKIMKYSSAGEVEALVYGGHSALTRFANNTIHQNVAEENYVVWPRTLRDGRKQILRMSPAWMRSHWRKSRPARRLSPPRRARFQRGSTR